MKSGRKYDLVIVDAPATGHGIGFLQTPRTFAAIARVGPIHSQAQQLDRLITDHDHTGTAIVSLPEEMPVNESAALEHDLRDEVGVAVDRVYMNGLYPERFSNEEAERLAELAGEEDGDAVRAAARARRSPSTAGPARQRAQLARLRRRVEAPVKTLPFLFEPELGVEAARPPGQEARLMPAVDEILEGKDICICAGSGGVGKTTTSAAIATGMAARGLKVCVLTIDPAKRLADSLGLEELGNEARRVDPKLFESQGVEMKGELWAMMLDAKATFDELVARQAPDEESRDRVLEQPHLPADLQRPGRLAGVHGDGEALRAAHRGPLRPARPRHAADPQRARLPRRAAPPDPVHRGPLAARLHEADRPGGAGRRARRHASPSAC